MANIRSAITGLSLFLRVLLLLLSVSECFVPIQGVGFGINYGQIANNLPSPSRVALLMQSMNVSRIKLYDADPNVLLAFANSNVEFVVGLGNEYLQSIRDPAKAQTWIQQHLQPYLSRTKITCITVGNEVFDSKDAQLISSLLPAMQSVHDALVNLGLDQQVSVTSAHSYKILSKSYPPSSGTFSQDLIQYIQPILSFHAQIKSPFLINAYPFFAYKDNPNEIDAVYYAIKALGFGDIEVRISETGWPSKGDPDEIGATPENAGIYNANLVKIMEQKQGTPANPSVPIDIYVFALFNENLKPGPTSERNYGLYYPDGTPVYNIGLQGYLPEMIISSKSNVLSVNFLVYLILGLVYIGEISRS
ncbi:hypothetical protein K1719_043623 [Acacia pycnantha]|nr:hypothetical protein K1719_045353 [Acacia pycnantha]KAI9074429.1 hypothetical protein K1719_043623 [Acacia pycnantha]